LDDVVPPRVAKTEVKYLDKTQTATLLKHLEGKADYPIILLAVTTAMRRGEVLGLRWCDAHLDAKDNKGKPDPHLRVTQNMTCVKGKAIPKEPKTASSRRRISLPSMTVEALRKHKAEQATVRLQLGLGRDPNGLLFTDYKGDPIIPSTLSRRFSRTVEKLDIPPISIHGLRHSHITQLLMEGVPIKVVSERAGHSSIVMTLDKYGHVVPDMQQNAAEVIDAQLREALAEHAEN
jgi:integrase